MARLLTAVFLALILVALPVSTLAWQDDLDCRGFASFAEANEYYAANPDAASAIDDDNDGEACEVYFGLETRDEVTGDAPTSGDVNVSDDLDCEDFATQEEAQAILDADSSDSNNLDPNRDGIACALLPSAESSSVAFAQDADPAEEGADDREARRAERQAQREQETAGEDPPANDALVCEDFFTQEEAQAAFDDDPAGQSGLDADGNGIACEDLPSASDQVEDDTQVDDAGEGDNRQERRNRRDRDQQETQDETVVDTPVTVGREDLDCIDFAFQEDAQEIYNRDPADPFNLDPNSDGFACSSLPSRDPSVLQVPRTGTGGTVQTTELWLMGSAALAGLAALARRRAARNTCRLEIVESSRWA